MMKFTSLTTIVVAAGLLLSWASDVNGQLWLQFAHPGSPHPGVNGPISSPALFADPTAVVQIPLLVVLLEFPDRPHRQVHSVAFWRDLVFGPRAGARPSVAEIFRENSNGRLLLVPALAGDIYDGNQDGIIGWVTSQHQTTDPYWDPPDTGPGKGRAEGIIVADTDFDYYVYDDSPSDGLITASELAVLVVFANDFSCDYHIGHPDPPGCTGHAGGKVTSTHPVQIPVDLSPTWPSLPAVKVQQFVAGVQEISAVGVVAHELGHQVLGLGDLYNINPAACATYQTVTDGYLCNNIWYPPRPGVYSMMDRYPDSNGIPPDVGYIPHLDPWAKIHHGFVKPLVVTRDGAYTLHDAETERDFSMQTTQAEALIIYDPLRAYAYQEYFILENRNIAGLPTRDEDQGLAVWLINEGVPNWPSGLDLRQVVRLVRRGGHFVDGNISLWDGTDDTQGYDLTATSSPRNTNWTDGSPSYIEIYDISEAGPAMTFKVRMPPIFVDCTTFSAFENGSQALPFDEVAEAIAAIPEAPRTIRIAGGYYPENLVINTPCTLKGWRNGHALIGK